MAAVTASSPRALVLAADEAVKDAVTAWLAAAGYEVCADAGPAAGAFLDQGPVDVVVADHVYPSWPGLGTLQAIKARTPGARVVVVSPGAGDPFTPMALAIGADRVVTGPLHKARVLAAMG